MWEIGDWLLAGEETVLRHLKKSKVREMAAEVTGYSRRTLSMAASVARKVSTDAPVDGRSWWHHLAASRVELSLQCQWLTRPAEGWSVPELRAHLRVHLTQPASQPSRGARLIRNLTAIDRNEISDELMAKLEIWWHSGRREADSSHACARLS